MDLFFYKKSEGSATDHLQCISLGGDFSEDYVNAVKETYFSEGYVCISPEEAASVEEAHAVQFILAEKESNEKEVLAAQQAAEDLRRAESERAEKLRQHRERLIVRRNRLVELGRTEEEADLILGLDADSPSS